MRSLRSAPLVGLAGVLSFVALAGCGNDDGGGSGGGKTHPVAEAAPVGRQPPALASDGVWVKGEPFTLEALAAQKRPVLVEMGFSSCKRCQATIPHLAGWSTKYGPKGLQVIFVNDGTVSPPLEGVRDLVKKLGVEFPVLHDEHGVTAKAYGVSAYPHVFLIDRTGHIVWDGSPMGRDALVESEIRKIVD